jgi:hypothetical protein
VAQRQEQFAEVRLAGIGRGRSHSRRAGFFLLTSNRKGGILVM